MIPSAEPDNSFLGEYCNSNNNKNNTNNNNVAPALLEDGGDLKDDNNNNNEHDENDVENPFHYLCAPQSIAIPSDLFHSTFDKHYAQIEKMNLRRDERPIISERGRWMIQKITPF